MIPSEWAASTPFVIQATVTTKKWNYDVLWVHELGNDAMALFDDMQIVANVHA